MKIQQAIGIDLGGTNVKGVLLSKDGAILYSLSQATEDQKEHLAFSNQWKNTVREMVITLKEKAKQPVPVGLSAPGLPNKTRKAIAYMPGRLIGLENLDWSTFLEAQKVAVLNDAKAALIAESYYGVGKNHQNIAMLTLGTGVGGAILIQGELHTGFFNRAGHLGHLSLQTEAPQGVVNLPGTLENFIGNATLKERSRGKYSSTNQLVKAYLKAEPLATLVWLKSVEKLALGLSSIINILSPELIILGGGITKADDALFQPLKTFMDLYEWRPGGIQTPIKKAMFEDYAGAVGAACFVLNQ